MFYNSINNKLDVKKFSDIFFSNIPKNKTLFFPFKILKLKKNQIFSLKNLNYVNFAFKISRLFINNISEENLYNIINKSYFNFNFNLVLNIEKIFNNNFLLNLNNGPTLTFKDIAMIPLGNILNFFSKKINKKFLIFCATSGDTGSSANNSFKNFEKIKLFTFYPFNMISNIQRKQITTLIKNNIKNISILGNFDTSQFLIKKIFENIKNNKKIFLISVNSINWFRIIFQTIYYCYCSLNVYKNNYVNFIIPSGNFGNSLSAFIAKKLGFPIEKIITCTNDNNFLDNFIKNNIIKNYSLKKTISPSIDISIPSNFLRLVNNNNLKNNQMNNINKSFFSDKINNKIIINSIEYFYNKYKKIHDPHTITSLTSLIKNEKKNNIVVSTSYPIKFIFAIKKIIPNLKIKLNIKKLFLLNEKYKIFSQNFNILINFIKKQL
ncbi:threonine synthase [Candidatus Carsonella ruddii]|uniref:Threonine synthase n=1 Tax=Carsonella ruddii TaxID=114186 RepID=A0A2K8K444_CARRU|nr:threonine synthase [Candidatus Carsonella ruddii]ATX33369.1 threonine synthase [Candidatus Carsonella ruddii]